MTCVVPHGTYLLHSTLIIPPNSRIVGEVWSVLMGAGPLFQDPDNPQPVVQVTRPDDTPCTIELSDLIFTVRGPAPGAIVLEWNAKAREQGSVGAWDCHVRIGGFAGSHLEGDRCLSRVGHADDPCRQAAFLGVHISKNAGGFFSNIWVWVADQ